MREEAGLGAGGWDTLAVLLAWHVDETSRVLVARGLELGLANERPERVHEEADVQTRWLSLEEAVDAVMSGAVESGITVGAVLAARTALARDRVLRPADALWPARKST